MCETKDNIKIINPKYKLVVLYSPNKDSFSGVYCITNTSIEGKVRRERKRQGPEKRRMFLFNST